MIAKIPGLSALAVAAALGLALAAPARADYQPLMQAALQDLQAAQAKLQQAERDKGGYRAKALTAVGNAIKEVEAGIAYANAHPSK